MPELPEVESVRLALEPVMVGRRIVRARLFRRDMLAWDARGRGRAEAGMLGGDRVVELERRGKQMALVGESGRSLVVQLGMSGQVLVLKAGSRSRLDHVHARWVLEDGTAVLFRDPRRFGGLTAIDAGDALERRWAGLGVDGLVVTGRDLHAALGGTARAIKAALLDQAVVAGVGNIYADESLHAAGIHPLRRGGGLSPAECGRLAGEVRRVLAEAIDAGGSTIRDYRGAAGDAGGFQSRHRVYGRGGLACLTCGRTLDSGTIAQRTSVWCRGCQPALQGL
ncbi:MAG: bifunctional DNA-formamidopyrimidine glycosylase/DNA-(apurinic or apyrimidinic site) lyase [Planctomycetes bacterium]|nr:bifunctional DNA-formamidopyrimidine glycosylase/DNA-(apurinic or apyrimidinic site) lyase [Planctomycetota bacterium]